MGWGGRWEGGSEWGARVNPWLIHVNAWQKPLQYCKVISLQLKEINFFKNLSRNQFFNFIHSLNKHLRFSVSKSVEDLKENMTDILF